MGIPDFPSRSRRGPSNRKTNIENELFHQPACSKYETDLETSPNGPGNHPKPAMSRSSRSIPASTCSACPHSDPPGRPSRASEDLSAACLPAQLSMKLRPQQATARAHVHTTHTHTQAQTHIHNAQKHTYEHTCEHAHTTHT